MGDDCLQHSSTFTFLFYVALTNTQTILISRTSIIHSHCHTDPSRQQHKDLYCHPSHVIADIPLPERLRSKPYYSPSHLALETFSWDRVPEIGSIRTVA